MRGIMKEPRGIEERRERPDGETKVRVRAATVWERAEDNGSDSGKFGK